MITLVNASKGKSMEIVDNGKIIGIVNYSTKKGVTQYKVDGIGLKNKILKGLVTETEIEMLKLINDLVE